MEKTKNQRYEDHTPQALPERVLSTTIDEAV